MLKILWYSTSPHSSTGYGNATREILRRFRKEGHEVQVATKHPLGGRIEVDGVTCFDGGDGDLVNIICQEEGFDYIISMADDWIFPPDFKFNKWVNVTFCDTHRMHPRLLYAAKKSLYTIAATKFTKEELEKNGRPCFYAPLGTNTSVFKPDEAYRKDFRDKRNWSDDTFVIGTLGLNYSNDRKNFINLLIAFAEFYKRHPDSLLYMHTDVKGKGTGNSLPLWWIIKDLGFKEDGTGPIQYVNQKDYLRWGIAEEYIARTYNSFDVFCFPTMGEGFGMPIIEAQACGVPTIVPDTTSCKELLKGGWLIECDFLRDMEFSPHMTWIMRTAPDRILEKLELAYDEWKSGKIKEKKAQAREGVLEYDWDEVYKTYWKPIFDYLDLEKQGKSFTIDTHPKYAELYGGFGNLFTIGDCNTFKHDKSCERFDKTLRLPKEPEDEPITILMRSYPLFPDASGEFYVHTKCAAYSFMPPRFINRCKAVWTEILSYPIVRTELQKMWEKEVKDNPDYVKLSDVTTVFDDNYSNFMQTFFSTSFRIGPEIAKFIEDCNSFIDVGCGDGFILKAIKENRPDAVVKGTEINSHWVDDKDVVYGDVFNLPFKDSEIDCVFSIDVLEHVSEPLKAITELVRVAKKKLVITITPVDDGCFEEDATHVVQWPFSQWKRELNEFGKIIAINPDKQAYTFLIEKWEV
jgi:glycosyltransferase involved in cell wall biosynthesis/ubiquinone/menaquinone biosynthesis C-methylase UbiE